MLMLRFQDEKNRNEAVNAYEANGIANELIQIAVRGLFAELDPRLRG